MIDVVVYGEPAPQGSKKGFHNKHTNRIQMVESSAKVKPWRTDIKQTIEDALPADQTPHEGPVTVRLTFTFPRPKNHHRTGKNAHLLRNSAPMFPAGARNDIDKLARAVLDAITASGAWKDDGQVVQLAAVKLYIGHPWALDRPGARIVITALANHDRTPA